MTDFRPAEFFTPHAKTKRLKQHSSSWSGCTRCDLFKGRTNVVSYRGSVSAKIVLVGGAPSQIEDRLGEPFAGKVGALLNQLLREAGLDPATDVAFVNMVGCRPLRDRTPHWKEISACRPRTEYMINVIEPRVIVLLGTTAAGMTGATSIGPWRGQPTEVRLPSFISETPEEYRAVITYHPSFLIRQGQIEKGKYRTNTVSDLKIARSMCTKAKSE